jgi:hypothetical protein
MAQVNADGKGCLSSGTSPAKEEIHVIPDCSSLMNIHLFFRWGGIELVLYFQKCSDKTQVVNGAGLVVPEHQLERVFGDEDRVRPFNSFRQCLGDELSGFDTCIVRSPKRPALSSALQELCTNVVISTNLRSYQRKAEEETTAPHIRPLRREPEWSAFHGDTLERVKQVSTGPKGCVQRVVNLQRRGGGPAHRALQAACAGAAPMMGQNEGEKEMADMDHCELTTHRAERLALETVRVMAERFWGRVKGTYGTGRDE